MTGGDQSSLVRTAADLLEVGSVHTIDLARQVLGLAGHVGAASAAVFELLGTDPRFRVDKEGMWSLDPDVVPLGAPLDTVRFAVVDVETTGGASWRGHRVTDISIVEVLGGEIVSEYESLVNPGRGIPPMITALTGITTDMVQGAPYFDHIADDISARLRGRVFVAHNATFDWGFVTSELQRATGDSLDVPQLCTVRMTRRLVPELRRRNLDVVTRHFGIDIHARHRAHGDALATARVLLRLLDEAKGRGIEDLSTLQWYLERRRQRKRFDPEQFSLELPGYEPRRRG
ncbi:MAG: exonuclease domain-containing protein [Gemmatimonadota bacterium]|nr:exonuclease domain-containing protein [Gemmatimonadota bacterium]MDE3006242.1 exonuclease domain-containing protein [Gemmatimonadota bacterium]MDE3014564.1 exonuclease domain-containing protein [Gemmatimonadota bacterium]